MGDYRVTTREGTLIKVTDSLEAAVFECLDKDLSTANILLISERNLTT